MFWKRLLFSYLIVIILILLVLGLAVYNQMNTSLKSQVVYSNEVVLEHGSTIFSDYIMDMKKLILSISIEKTLQQEITQFLAKPHLEYSGIHENIQRNKYLQTLSENYVSCKIYPIRAGTLYDYNEYTNQYKELQIDQFNDHLLDAYQKHGGFILKSTYARDNNTIIIAHIIYNVEGFEEPIGVIELTISEIAIYNLLYNIKLENNITPILADADGVIFLPYNRSGVISEKLMSDYSEEYLEKDGKVILRRNIIGTSWKLFGFIPEKNIDHKLSGMQRAFLYTGLITVIVLVLLSSYFATWLSQPLRRLSERLQQFKEGKFQPLEVKKKYSTEVKILYEQYNSMIEKIDNLIDQVYEAAEKEKQAELLALQAQINPHFLYNTLDSINWLALKYKAYDIRFMVNSLANMMRYSLNSGKNFISLRDEVEQVRNYVAIQEIRHNNKFKTYFEFEEDILDYEIIKLLIQPLVENAISHGFKNSKVYGEIVIKGFEKQGNLIILVVNEGDCIDLDKINAILHPQNNERPKSYGISNVNDRVIKQYGEQFGLKFYTEKGKTYAKIELPIILLRREKDYE